MELEVLLLERVGNWQALSRWERSELGRDLRRDHGPGAGQEVHAGSLVKSFVRPDGTGHRKSHLEHGVCMVTKRKSADAFHITMAWIAFLQERLGR